VDDPQPLQGASVSLDGLPPAYVGRNTDGIWLLVAGKLGGLGPGAGCDGPVAKIARDLRVAEVGPDDVVLVDYKAGFEDSARGALVSLDWALAVVDPTTTAVQMAIHLAQMAAEIRAGVPPATRHLEDARLVDLAVRLFREASVLGTLCVLNRLRDAATGRYLRRALQEHNVPVLGAFQEVPEIQDQWLRGARLGSDVLLEEATTVARRLETHGAAVAQARHAPSSVSPTTIMREPASEAG
jgi:CO dehydrogenase nickel-insertion accessory protein CooC1